jgi:dienelactone hydrolase
MRRWIMLLTVLLLVTPLQAEIRSERVDYEVNGTRLQGYLAWDDAVDGPRPGVLVVHEWWGQNEYARERARMLAELGYTALALDMYGLGKTADHPKEAQAFMQAVLAQQGAAEQRFLAAKTLLEQQPQVDAARIAAIGYCFGGAVVLEMARRGVELAAGVSFHGSLGTENPARPGEIQTPLLVLNGADDPLVPPEQVAALEREMRAADAEFRIVNYPGAVHSFTNPRADEVGKKFAMPLAYHPEADRQSWQEMQRFLEAAFAQ